MKLSGREAGYSASDVEMLAVIYALREWRCYLEGQTEPFVIETDHPPNTYVDQSTNQHTLKRIARCLYESSALNYVWKYRLSTSDVADPLLRAPQHFAIIHSGGLCVHTLDSITAHAQPAVVALLFRCSVRGARPAERGARRGKRRTQRVAVESVQPIAQAIKGYLVDDLLGRCRQGCEEMQCANQQRFAKLKLIRHQDVLYWTADDRLYVAMVGTLRDECVEAIRSNPKFGNYGVARTIRKMKEVCY